jgi:predicted permease
LYTRVLEEVRALPGVTSAAYVTGLPMEMRGGIWAVSLPGREETRDGSLDVSVRMVTPQFFSTLQIPLQRGRDVAESDTQKSPFVAVVSESFAKRHWPSEDPIGKRFTVALAERTIVGVVGDVRVRGLERSSEPQVYLSYQQVPDGGLIGYIPKELVVRTAGVHESLIAPITRVIRRADPEQPVSDVRLLSAVVGEETASRVTQVRVLVVLAAIALLIAGIGIHGLLMYTVSRRSQELGVRRVLGAQASEIVQGVVREGAILAAIGIGTGMVIAYVAARGMDALLVGIRPTDPLTFAVASVLCFVTVLVGTLRPALRAASVDPLIALRAE